MIKNIFAPQFACDIGAAHIRFWDKTGKLCLDQESVFPSKGKLYRLSKFGLLRDEELFAQWLVSVRGKLAWKLTHDFLRPGCVVLTSIEVDPTHKRAVERAFVQAGFGKITFLLTPLVLSPSGTACIVDMGASKTDIALVSAGTVKASRTIRQGTDDVKRALQEMLEKKYDILVSDEQALQRIDKFCGFGSEKQFVGVIKGKKRTLFSSVSIRVGDFEIESCLLPLCQAVVRSLRCVLITASASEHDTITQNGVSLIGAGSHISHLDDNLHLQSDISIHSVESLSPIHLQAIMDPKY